MKSQDALNGIGLPAIPDSSSQQGSTLQALSGGAKGSQDGGAQYSGGAPSMGTGYRRKIVRAG